jgi:hypothetical protein
MAGLNAPHLIEDPSREGMISALKDRTERGGAKIQIDPLQGAKVGKVQIKETIFGKLISKTIKKVTIIIQVVQGKGVDDLRACSCGHRKLDVVHGLRDALKEGMAVVVELEIAWGKEVPSHFQLDLSLCLLGIETDRPGDRAQAIIQRKNRETIYLRVGGIGTGIVVDRTLRRDRDIGQGDLHPDPGGTGTLLGIKIGYRNRIAVALVPLNTAIFKGGLGDRSQGRVPHRIGNICPDRIRRGSVNDIPLKTFGKGLDR